MSIAVQEFVCLFKNKNFEIINKFLNIKKFRNKFN